MRILFTSFPAYGHLHPVVPLALAAMRAGHEVRVAAGPNIVGWAGRCGLDAHAIGLSEDDLAEVADRDFAGPERTGHMFTDVWVGAAIPDLVELTSSWLPDVVVHEEEEYAAPLLAAMLGVPCVTQSWSAPARPVGGQQFALQALDPIWQRFLPGSPPRRVGGLYLDACPPQFQTADLEEIARTARVVAIRPSLFDGPPAEPPHFLAELPRPAAYVTLGTVAVFSTPELLRRIATALSPVVASVVLTTGPNSLDDVGSLPANVYALPYLAQSLVLPTVDLMVSHGGAGGTVGALVHGLPHLVLPGEGMSQQTIAEGIQRVGVGLRLTEEHRGAEDIAAAAARLLGEPRFATTAREVRRSLELLPGPDQLVGLLAVS
jgi:UDP:flavonoid glycosyltransferase YjiC (YdhE family)